MWRDLARLLTLSRIQNPLFGIPKDVLFRDVDQFTRENGFEDQELFRKAALIGQNPGRFEQYDELDENDKQWLRMEKTRESGGRASCRDLVG